MATIPKIQKKVNSFLRKEDGKISKEKLLKTGVLLGIVTLGTLKNAKALSWTQSYGCGTCGGPSTSYGTHCNTLGSSYSGSTLTGSHSHHGNHCSHASHGSHGSHGQW